MNTLTAPRISLDVAASAGGHGPGRGKKNQQAVESFTAYLKQINLEHERAREAQRIDAI